MSFKGTLVKKELKEYYADPNLIIEKIDDYFFSLKQDEYGNQIPPTVSGMAFALGIDAARLTLIRQGFYKHLNPDNHEEVLEALKYGYAKIEIYNEESLYDKNKFYGAKFVMGIRYNYYEKKQMEVDNKVTVVDDIPNCDELCDDCEKDIDEYFDEFENEDNEE